MAGFYRTRKEIRAEAALYTVIEKGAVFPEAFTAVVTEFGLTDEEAERLAEIYSEDAREV